MSAQFILSLDDEATRFHPVPCSGGAEVTLRVGLSTLTRLWRNHVPSDADIERAIDVVEEEISQGGNALVGALVRTSDDHVRQIAVAAGLELSAGTVVTAEAVENLFTRMTASAYGAAVAQDRLPQSPRFAASLLILRELMHHFNLAMLAIEDPAATDAESRP